MKVVFLNLYSGINSRGAESFLHELAPRLAPGRELFLISAAPTSLKNVQSINIPVPIFQPRQNFSIGPLLAILKRFFLDPAQISAIIFTLKALPTLLRLKPDIILPHNGFWQLLICKLISIRGAKVIVIGHSGPGWDERWNLYLRPHLFVATTTPTLDWARRTAPWTKAVLIPYAIDPSPWESVAPKSLLLEKPIILCPAAAESTKRIDLALKAVAKLPRGSLLHLGTGRELESLKALGLKLLGPKRFLSKAVSYEEMPAYYKASDVVTLPSHPQENSPMVFLESLAASKLVVTTDTPRFRWILEDEAEYVTPEDTDNYAQGLTTAINRSPLAKSHALQKFTWVNVLKSYEDAFKNLVS